MRTWLLSGTTVFGKTKREHRITWMADESVAGGPMVVASDWLWYMDQVELGIRVARLYRESQ